MNLKLPDVHRRLNTRAHFFRNKRIFVFAQNMSQPSRVIGNMFLIIQNQNQFNVKIDFEWLKNMFWSNFENKRVVLIISTSNTRHSRTHPNINSKRERFIWIEVRHSLSPIVFFTIIHRTSKRPFSTVKPNDSNDSTHW